MNDKEQLMKEEESIPPPYEDATNPSSYPPPQQQYTGVPEGGATGVSAYPPPPQQYAPPPPGGYPAAPYTTQPGYQHPGYVAQPGVPGPPIMVVSTNPMPMEYIPDYMVFNIIVTIFCCWPIGLVGILRSDNCKDAIRRGDTVRAQQLSREARNLGRVALGCGICIIAAVIILTVVFVALQEPY